MIEKEIKQYTVVMLLNSDGSKVLLQLKDRTLYKGKLNGTGGKVEDGETPEQCAYREIAEETSLQPKDIDRLTWLGTLILPEQCDDRYEDMLPELWFYSGIVKDENLVHKPDTETERLFWCDIDGYDIVTNGIELAGEGNIPYFVRTARRLLFNIR